MPAKTPTDTSPVYIPDDAVVEFSKLPANSAGYISGPAPSSANFAWYGRPRGSNDDWLFLSDVISSASWTDDLTTGTVSGTLSMDNRPDENGVRLHTRLPTGSEIRLMYLPFGLDIESLSLMQSSGEKVTAQLQEVNRFVLWESDTESGGSDVLTGELYDLMKYLIESETTVLFETGSRKKSWSPTEITQHICHSQGIILDKVPTSKNHIPFFYAESTSIWDVLVQVWTLDHKSSGRNFFLRMFEGKLQILVKESKPPAQVLEIASSRDGGILISSSKSETMDGIKTGVQMFGTAKSVNNEDGGDDREVVAQSKKYVNLKAAAQFGRLWHEETVQGVTDPAKLDHTAQVYLKYKSGLSYSAAVTIVGLPWLRAGDPVYCNDPSTGLVGLHWFKQIDHNYDGSGSYTASGDLVPYDFTFTENADRSDLKAQLPSGSDPGGGLTAAQIQGLEDGTLTTADILAATGGTGGSSSGSSGSATPAEITKILIDALVYLMTYKKKLGLRGNFALSWADDAGLSSLIQHESSYNFLAFNPLPCMGNHAMGLFQICGGDDKYKTVGIVANNAFPSNYPKGYSPDGSSGYVTKGTGGAVGLDGQMHDWKFWQCATGLAYIGQAYSSLAAATGQDLAPGSAGY